MDLPPSTDPYSAEVYKKAADNFARIQARAPLIREAEDSLYIYRLSFEGRSQTGIAATFSVDEYDRGEIKKHEKTRQEKEDDRTRHILSLRAQTGPVFLIYRDLPLLHELIAQETRHPALFDFQASDGVHHIVWRVRVPWAVAKALRRSSIPLHR